MKNTKNASVTLVLTPKRFDVLFDVLCEHLEDMQESAHFLQKTMDPMDPKDREDLRLLKRWIASVLDLQESMLEQAGREA